MQDTQWVQALNEHLLNTISTKNERLENAIDQSINQSLFNEADIRFALSAWEKALQQGRLLKWYEQVIHPINRGAKTTLMVLAGNLPLVGLQDVLAGILYNPPLLQIKLSKKDPHLIPALFYEFNLPTRIEWVTSFDQFTKNEVKKWVFTGDVRNFEQVQRLLRQGTWIASNAQVLRRKAAYSVLLLKDFQGNAEQFFNGFFRYQGKGCRSVGVILAEEWKEIEQLIIKMKEQLRLPDSEESIHLAAFLKSLGYQAIALVDKVFTNDPSALESIQTVGCYTIGEWLKMHTDTDRIQQYYNASEDMIEPLKIEDWQKDDFLNAQEPALGWKADGMDTLDWLFNT